jgi:hypothetical protein
MFEQRGLVALVVGGSTAELLDLGTPTFLGATLLSLRSPDLCRNAWRCGSIHRHQPRREPRKRDLAIGRLRATLCGRHGQASRAVRQPHAGGDFIAMLAARPAGDKERYIGNLLKRRAVGRIECGRIL